MTKADAPDLELNRAHAERALSRIRHRETFAAEQVASMSKWLTASLLAINGGGAIAALNRADTVNHAWSAGMLFIAGIAFALLSAVAMQEIYNRVSDPLLELDKYWTRVSITGARNIKTEAALQAPLNAISRFYFIPPLMGWISGILFLVGAVVLAR